MTNTREWAAWRRIVNRCGKRDHYRDVGVCERWRSFQNFYRDMGPMPHGMTIERKDNSRGYSPDNCRWATMTEQNRNKRSNVRLTAFGRTMLAADWAREAGISQTTIADRLQRGWPVEDAVSVKPGERTRWKRV